MALVRTFIDADVLIWAAGGREALSQIALDVLTAQDRKFVASDFLRLEVLPKAVYYGQQAEEAFYRRFLAGAATVVSSTAALITLAERRAFAYGLSAVDSLHVAAAEMAGAIELVTAERATSPLFRVKEVRVVSIRPAAMASP